MTFKEELNIFLMTKTVKKQKNISWLVWLIENPKSPFHLHELRILDLIQLLQQLYFAL